MKWLIGTTLAAVLLPGLASADDRDDDNGKRRSGWYGWYNETPDWARGRGYWDGRNAPVYPPPDWRSPAPRYYPRYYPPPVIEFRYAPPYGWSKDGWKEWDKELRERDKELRKREEEAYKEQRKRDKEAYKKWRER